MKRLVLILGLVIVLPLSARAEPVTVGLYHNPPLIDLEGEEPGGFFVDLLQGLSGGLGWSVQFVSGDFADILERTVNGEIDLMAAAALTPARAERMAFNAAPLLSVWGALYQAPDTPLLTLADLDHLTIARQSGTVFSDEMERICQAMAMNCLWEEITDPTEALSALRDGYVDAVLTDSARAASWVARGEMIPSAIAFSPFALHLAGEPGLLASFDHVLEEKNSATEAVLAQAFETWLPQPVALPQPVVPGKPSAPIEPEAAPPSSAALPSSARPLSSHPAVFYSLVLIIALCLFWISEGPKWRRRRAGLRAATINQAALDDLLHQAGLSEVTVAADQTITAIRPRQGIFDAKAHLGWTLPGLCINPEEGRQFLKEVRSCTGRKATTHHGWLDLRDGSGPGRTFAISTQSPEREDAPLRLILRDVTGEAENEDRWARDLTETEDALEAAENALVTAEAARIEAIREAEPDRILVTLLRSLPGALDQSTETGRDALIGTLLAHSLTLTKADRISRIRLAGDHFHFDADVIREPGLPERRAIGVDFRLADYPWLAERLVRPEPFRLPNRIDFPDRMAPERALFDASETLDAFFVPIRIEGEEATAWAGLEIVQREEESNQRLSAEDLSLIRMIGAVTSGFQANGSREATELREVV
ncbi:MAG: substrate-binding periplasmic protein [Magnetovibrionaceae bacterium]